MTAIRVKGRAASVKEWHEKKKVPYNKAQPVTHVEWIPANPDNVKTSAAEHCSAFSLHFCDKNSHSMHVGCEQSMQNAKHGKEFKLVQQLGALLTMEGSSSTVEIQQKCYRYCLNSANGKVEMKSSHALLFCTLFCLYLLLLQRITSDLKIPGCLFHKKSIYVFLICHQSAGPWPNYVQPQCEKCWNTLWACKQAFYLINLILADEL